MFFFFFSSRRRHTRYWRDWSSDVCSSDLPGAQRLAVTSGGTIPDRGLFGVFLVGEKASRVGELDEEMVYESRVGDVFLLGSSSWRSGGGRESVVEGKSGDLGGRRIIKKKQKDRSDVLCL